MQQPKHNNHVLTQQWNKLKELLKDKENKDDKAALKQ